MSNYFSTTNMGSVSASQWNISSLSRSTSYIKDANAKKLDKTLSYDKYDYFQVQERTLLNGLFKSIPSEKAEQLLATGVEDSEAVVQAITDYVNDLPTLEKLVTSQAANTRDITIGDYAGNATTYELSQLYDNTLTLTTNDLDDIINLGGDQNDVTLTLSTGNNTVNIDASQDSDFNVTGGAGTDTVNLSGNVGDYRFNDNGDGTLTFTNSVSNATVTIDSNVNTLNLDDGSVFTYDGATLSLSSTSETETITLDSNSTVYNISSNQGNDTIDFSGTGNTLTLSMDSGNNTLNVDGTNNTANVTLSYSTDRIYVAAGNNNVVNVDTGFYTDNVVLDGIAADWTLAGNTYTHNTTGTAVTVSNAEAVYFASIVTDAADTSSNFDYTAFVNSSEILNAGNGDDTVSLGGTGNDIVVNLDSGTNSVTVDDTNINVFRVNGGTGTDTLTMSGNLSDYTIEDLENGTIEFTNTTSVARTIVDSEVENIVFADGNKLSFDGTNITVSGTLVNDTLNIDGINDDYVVNLYQGNDSVNVNGSYNNVDIYAHNDDDNIFIGVGYQNDVYIDGAHGVDSLTLQGTAAIWSVDGTGQPGTTYTNTATGTVVTLGTDVENVTFDGNLVFIDAPDNNATMNILGFNNSTIFVDAKNLNDVVNLDGANNTVTVDMSSGTNTINIDDSASSTYQINPGLDYDTVNLVGSHDEYTYVRNADDTITLTNTTSGAVLDFDRFMTEEVNLADTYIDPTTDTMVITGTAGINAINPSAFDGFDITINPLAGDDTIVAGGFNNDYTMNLGSGNNAVTIDDTLLNTYDVNGGTGTDTLTFTGAGFTDYTITDLGGGDYTIDNGISTSTTDINVSVDYLEFTDNAANPLTYDLNTTYNFGMILNTADGDDTITLSAANNDLTVNFGSGTNVANIDDSIVNTAAVNGGIGADTVNMASNMSDYSFTDNADGTFTMTNTATTSSTTLDGNLEAINLGDATTIGYDGTTITLNDIATNNNTFNLNTGSNATIVVNNSDGDDTINMGGTGNTITANLNSGTNIVNADTTNANTFIINGGAGVDTANISGGLSDYTFTDNGNNTLTMTNTVSTATVTIDTAVEAINIADGSVVNFDGTTITITDAVGRANTFDLTGGTNTNFVINTLDQNDTVNLGGTGNTVTANLGSGDNIVNVDTTNANTFAVNGGTGSDTVNMLGTLADYTFTDNGDGSMTITNILSTATTTFDTTVENINIADGSVVNYDGVTITITDAAGRSNIFDMTGGVNTNFTINTLDMNDTVNLGGTNNTVTANLGSGTNTVNINDTIVNAFTVNGGTGADSVNFAADSLSNYSFTDNGDSTYTITNTSSGATTTVDSNVETINFTDTAGASTFTLNDTMAANIVVDAGDSNDTLNLVAANNSVIANLNSGNNVVNVTDNVMNTTVINGGTGTDTVNLNGGYADYNFVDNGDSTMTITNTVSGATTTVDNNVEDIYLSDGVLVNFDGTTVTLTDTAANANNFDMTTKNNSNYAINTLDNNDTVSFGGTNNTMVANLGSGTNSVNLDTTNNNSFTVNGGVGVDTVNMSGNFADYTIADNGDNTFTLTDTVSGATSTIDNNVESTVFADNITMSFDGSTFTINDAAAAADIFNLTTTNNSTFVLNTLDNNDTASLGGNNNTGTVNLGSGTNVVNVDTSNNNTFVINGGVGADTVSLSGSMSNYSFQDNGDNTLTITNTGSGATTTIDTSVENINIADGSIVSFDGSTISLVDALGNSNTFDTSTSNNSTITIDASDMNDVVNLGGNNNNVTTTLNSGTNTVNVDTSNNNTFVINGGLGTDTVNFSGSMSDYLFQDNGDNTLTITNTGSGATTTIDTSVENINIADGSLVSFDGSTISLIDAFGNSNTFDTSSSNNSTITIDASDMNDVVNLAGNNNNVVVNLNSGTNTVNIDDSNNNIFVVNGGTGSDTVNLAGNFADYSFVDNGDTTLTLTNTISGASITFDSALENINFGDSVSMTYDGANISVTGTAGVDNLTIDGTNANFSSVTLGSGDDTLFVATGSNNTIVVDGEADNDTVTLEGASADWTLLVNTYTHNISSTSVTVNNVESVLFTA